MGHKVTTRPYESPEGDLYDPVMAKTQRMSVEKARPRLGQLLDAAAKEETHTVIAKHGEPAGVLVPMDWYRRMRQLDNDPTDL